MFAALAAQDCIEKALTRVIALSRKPWENGSDLNSDRWEKIGTRDQFVGKTVGKRPQLFPIFPVPRTLVLKLNLLLVERGTGLEPATSTLGTRRQQSIPIKGYPRKCLSQVERSSVVYMRQCPSVGKSWECGK